MSGYCDRACAQLSAGRGRRTYGRGSGLASVPGLPRSVRVLIVRRRQTFKNRGRPLKILYSPILGLQAIKGHNIVNIYKMMFYPLSITWGRPGVPGRRNACRGPCGLSPYNYYVRMLSPAYASTYAVCFARMGILLTLWSASCTCHSPELTYYDALAS